MTLIYSPCFFHSCLSIGGVAGGGGEVGGSAPGPGPYQWIEWERAHNKLRCFGVTASSFKTVKNKKDNIWPTCLESAVSGMRRAECVKMRSC